jgi:hypothetical protein
MGVNYGGLLRRLHGHTMTRADDWRGPLLRSEEGTQMKRIGRIYMDRELIFHPDTVQRLSDIHCNV